MKVCVIGAGIVGCATAFELQRAGHQVTLLDSAMGPGQGTTFANGAQLSYSYVEPMANPSTFWSLPELLFGRTSPVKFCFRADPAQWAWGLRFLLSCRGSIARRGTRELLELAELSRITLEHWLRDTTLDFGFKKNGKLVLCPNFGVLQRQTRQVALQAQYSSARQEVLDRNECLRIEPTLKHYEDFIGGIWSPGECLGDPHQLSHSLCQKLQENGGSTLFGVKAISFLEKRPGFDAVRTSHGEIRADKFVLCTGIETSAMARQLGEYLPIYPIKGYSVTLDMKTGALLPVVSVTDLGHKMVLAPLNGKLRVAAMAEIIGHDLSIPWNRIESMLHSVERIYPELCDPAQPRTWAGLRPSTPNSIPIVRRSKVANVILNVGHGALGFTLAAGSARLVVNLIDNRPSH